MTPDEHLDTIIAKCRAIIALGKARTAGKWDNSRYHYPRFIVARRGEADNDAFPGDRAVCEVQQSKPSDAAFIAACAGPAEAAAASTIAAIEWAAGLHSAWKWVGEDVIDAIRAAWPEETLL